MSVTASLRTVALSFGIAAAALVGFAALVTTTPDTATVARVVDGDTLDLATGERVRLLGVDAPERGQCGALEATDALRELVEGQDVQVIGDPMSDTTDRYGRTLAYIEHAGVDIGQQLVHDGRVGVWAPSATTPARTPAYLVAQADAQKAQRGSWKACQAVGR